MQVGSISSMGGGFICMKYTKIARSGKYWALSLSAGAALVGFAGLLTGIHLIALLGAAGAGFFFAYGIHARKPHVEKLVFTPRGKVLHSKSSRWSLSEWENQARRLYSEVEKENF